MADETVVRCGCRRHRITGLHCARCNAPICPDCSVPFAVGMMCRACSRTGPSRLYQVEPGRFALAIVVCLAAATFGGSLLADLSRFGFFLLLWGGLMYGLAVAELALRVTGRKRGLPMEILAGSCAALGIAFGWALTAHYGDDLLHAMQGYLMQAPTLLLVGIAVVSSVGRIRNL